MTHNRWLLVGLIVAALAAAVGIQAHEGHSHRIMGSVSAVRPGGHLEIRTAEGRAVTVMLGRETRILKGSSPGVADDISAGARVVVSFTEQGDMKMATEVRLAQAGPEKQQAPEAASPPHVRDGENEGAGRLGPEGHGEDPALGGRPDDESRRDGDYRDDGGEGDLPDSLRDSNAAAYRRGFEDGYRAAIEGRHSLDSGDLEGFDPTDDCLGDQGRLQRSRHDIPNARLYP